MVKKKSQWHISYWTNQDWWRKHNIGEVGIGCREWGGQFVSKQSSQTGPFQYSAKYVDGYDVIQCKRQKYEHKILAKLKEAGTIVFLSVLHEPLPETQHPVHAWVLSEWPLLWSVSSNNPSTFIKHTCKSKSLSFIFSFFIKILTIPSPLFGLIILLKLGVPFFFFYDTTLAVIKAKIIRLEIYISTQQ